MESFNLSLIFSRVVRIETLKAYCEKPHTEVSSIHRFKQVVDVLIIIVAFVLYCSVTVVVEHVDSNLPKH